MQPDHSPSLLDLLRLPDDPADALCQRTNGMEPSLTDPQDAWAPQP